MERRIVRKLKREWEEMGQMDMLFFIRSKPEAKFGNWDLDEFFASGEDEISHVIAAAQRLGRPKETELALDFGCGVGRLTRALTPYFSQVYGVDISEPMIDSAQKYNASETKCEFFHYKGDDLSMFSDSKFDLIYTRYVLQHIPSKKLVKFYIQEMLRTLKPEGLLVFQIPGHLPLRNRLQPRRRLYSLLKTLRLPGNFLYAKLQLDPVISSFLDENEVSTTVSACDGIVLEIQRDAEEGPARNSRIYYVTKTALN